MTQYIKKAILLANVYAIYAAKRRKQIIHDFFSVQIMFYSIFNIWNTKRFSY